MKERNKLIIAIVAVVLIVVVVVGATYAYWSWSTNSAQATTIEFTVPTKDSQLSASLAGGGTTTVSNLAPAACTNSTYAMKKAVVLTYKNLTTQAAQVKATLTVSNWNQPHTGTLRLSNLHYALTTGTAGGDNCNSGTNRTLVAGGTNSAFVTSGALPNGSNYTGLNNTVILDVPANTAETSKTYYLWVWLDAGDNGSNTGATVTDPMQDITFKLTWTGTIENVT
jgi:hypothetical protein